jgi:hypothetical protein
MSGLSAPRRPRFSGLVPFGGFGSVGPCSPRPALFSSWVGSGRHTARIRVPTYAEFKNHEQVGLDPDRHFPAAGRRRSETGLRQGSSHQHPALLVAGLAGDGSCLVGRIKVDGAPTPFLQEPTVRNPFHRQPGKAAPAGGTWVRTSSRCSGCNLSIIGCKWSTVTSTHDADRESEALPDVHLPLGFTARPGGAGRSRAAPAHGIQRLAAHLKCIVTVLWRRPSSSPTTKAPRRPSSMTPPPGYRPAGHGRRSRDGADAERPTA